ncbi:hypothetical protein L1887_44357 [Cichorium endivia]|nr:hypothetical protein L1887_44357 [Cichorium endivia]
MNVTLGVPRNQGDHQRRQGDQHAHHRGQAGVGKVGARGTHRKGTNREDATRAVISDEKGTRKLLVEGYGLLKVMTTEGSDRHADAHEPRDGDAVGVLGYRGGSHVGVSRDRDDHVGARHEHRPATHYAARRHHDVQGRGAGHHAIRRGQDEGQRAHARQFRKDDRPPVRRGALRQEGRGARRE